MLAEPYRHRVTIAASGADPFGLYDVGITKTYEFQSSMIEPADSFSFRLPFTTRAKELCRLDATIAIAVDGAVQMTGLVADVWKDSKARTLEVSGLDKVGRLVATSIGTATGWDGLDLVATVKALAAPWFTDVTLSNAENRAVKRGRGHRASAYGEPAILKSVTKSLGRGLGKTQKIDPGSMRWTMIAELCASVGLVVWATADGKRLIIGKPNYEQQPQFGFVDSKEGSTVTAMKWGESNGDRYAAMEIQGAARGSSVNFGADVIHRSGTVYDGPGPDGIGRDFLHPKHVLLPQNAVQSNQEATRVALREKARRDFKARSLHVSCQGHGQIFKGGTPTVFGTDLVATCADDETPAAEYLIHSVTFKGSEGSEGGATSDLQLVPRGTEFVA